MPIKRNDIREDRTGGASDRIRVSRHYMSELPKGFSHHWLTTRPRSRVISRDVEISDYIKSESQFPFANCGSIYGVAVRDWARMGLCSRLPLGAYGSILAVRDFAPMD